MHNGKEKNAFVRNEHNQKPPLGDRFHCKVRETRGDTRGAKPAYDAPRDGREAVNKGQAGRLLAMGELKASAMGKLLCHLTTGVGWTGSSKGLRIRISVHGMKWWGIIARRRIWMEAAPRWKSRFIVSTPARAAPSTIARPHV